MEAFIGALAAPLGQALVALLNVAIIMLLKWGREKIKSEGAIKALEHVTLVAQTVVVSLNQEVVAALKNDGKFDAQEKARIKATAVTMVNQQLPKTVTTAAGYLINDLNSLIDQLIERAVVRAKAEEGMTALPK